MPFDEEDLGPHDECLHENETLTARVDELEDQSNRFRELFENIALEILRFSGDAKFSEWVDQHRKDVKGNES